MSQLFVSFSNRLTTTRLNQCRIKQHADPHIWKTASTDSFHPTLSSQCKASLNQKIMHHFKMTHFLSNQIYHGLYQFSFFWKANDKRNGCTCCLLFAIGMINQYFFDVFFNNTTQRGSVGSCSPSMMFNLNPNQIPFEYHQPQG